MAVQESTATLRIPLTHTQTRLIVVAWITYAAYYFGRVNLSPVLAPLQADLHWSKTEIGLLGSVFFWSYGIGQLINGALGDRLGTREFVTFGLVAFAVANLIFGTSSIFIWMLLIWAANGYFQAMGWGPILHTLAQHLTTEQRTRLSTMFGTSFVAGNALTWLLVGLVVALTNWRGAFLVATPLMLLFALLWWLGVRDIRSHGQESTDSSLDFVRSTIALLKGRRIWIVALVAALVGVVQGGFFLWTPTLLFEVQKIPLDQATYSSVILPIAGIIGIVGFGALITRVLGSERAPFGLALLLFILGVTVGLYGALVGQLPIFSALALLAIVGAIAYAVTSLILTLLPLRLGGRARSSTMAGLMDFAFNIGTSISGVITGLLLDRASWNAVFLFWALAGIIAAALLTTQLPQLGKTVD